MVLIFITLKVGYFMHAAGKYAHPHILLKLKKIAAPNRPLIPQTRVGLIIQQGRKLAIKDRLA